LYLCILTLSTPAHHPVHNVDRMFGGLVARDQFMSVWGSVRLRAFRGLASDSGRVIQAFRDSLAPTSTSGITKAPSDSPDSFKRHEPSGRSGACPGVHATAVRQAAGAALGQGT
jgi:hypothetical protein